MDIVPYEELQKGIDHPIGEVISPEQYKILLESSDAARQGRFLEAILAGANNYTLMALGHIDATPQAMVEADFIKEIKDFLPKLEEYRKISYIFSQALFRH